MVEYLKLVLDVIQFLLNLMQQLTHIENIYHFYFLDLLPFSFLSSLEKLPCDISNTSVKLNQI